MERIFICDFLFISIGFVTADGLDDSSFDLAHGWSIDWVQVNFKMASFIAPARLRIPFRISHVNPSQRSQSFCLFDRKVAPSQERPKTCKPQGEIVVLDLITSHQHLAHRKTRQASHRPHASFRASTRWFCRIDSFLRPSLPQNSASFPLLCYASSVSRSP